MGVIGDALGGLGIGGVPSRAEGDSCFYAVDRGSWAGRRVAVGRFGLVSGLLKFVTFNVTT